MLTQRRRFLVPTQLKTSDDFYNSFGKPGGGAPRCSDSGNVVASVVADPDMRFQKQLKKEIDQSLVSMCTCLCCGFGLVSCSLH